MNLKEYLKTLLQGVKNYVDKKTTIITNDINELNNRPIKFAPIHNTWSNTSMQYLYVDVNKLEENYLYCISNEYYESKMQTCPYIVYVADDNTEKSVFMGNPLNAFFYVTRSSDLIQLRFLDGDAVYYIDARKHATANDVIVSSEATYLKITNSFAYTPTFKYHPATKQYVDDSVDAIPEQTQADWNEKDENSPAFIQNAPTKLSNFENDLNLDIPTKLSDLEIDVEVGVKDYNNLENKPNIPTKLSDLEIDMEVGGAQPDWNQNDETANDFIKNRPFYTVERTVATILEETTAEGFQEMNGFLFAQDPFYIDPYSSLVLGKTYKVIWDGTEYECVCNGIYIQGAYTYTYILGNMNYYNMVAEGDIPFCLFVEPAMIGLIKMTNESSNVISIFETETTIHKLDEKYLPDTIARKTDLNNLGGGSGSSAQPDWNQNDETAPSYIKNRTHWVEKTIIHPATTLSREAQPYSWFIPYIECGKTYKVIWDGTEYECVARLPEHDGGMTLGNASIYYSGYENTGEPFCIYTYMYYGAFFVTNVYSSDNKEHTVAIEGLFEQGIADPSSKYILMPIVAGNTYDVMWDGTSYSLEAKIIQDNWCVIGNPALTGGDFADTGEPFCFSNDGGMYTTEGEHTFSIDGLIPERTHVFIKNESEGYGIEIPIETNMEFTVGKTYIVVFDGNEYEVTCFDVYGYTSCMGNWGLVNICCENTGEPFFIRHDNDYNETAIVMIPGSHEIKIMDCEYHTIDEKFIPSSVMDRITALESLINGEEVEF